MSPRDQTENPRTATNAVEVEETVWIPMPDGTRLAARVWRPKTKTPVPAIVEYIPYRRRDGTRLRDETTHPRFAEAGYASLRVDMRGTGDSDGIMADEYLEAEIQDGCDLIAWIAEQPWCNGKVGMFGKSWGAFTALQIAARRPPALRAIIPVMGTDDRFGEDIHFSGGVLLNDNFWWGSIMLGQIAMPPDPDVVGEAWRGMWKARLDAMSFWPTTWLKHQTRDAFWKHGSVCEAYNAIEVPVYYVGGWADLYRDTAFRLAENLSGPYKALMGPWAHLYPHEARPGPQVDFVAEALRWWDHWLTGKPGAIMNEPRFTAYLQDSAPPLPAPENRAGRWVEMDAWPTEDVTRRTLWLNTEVLGTKPDTEGPNMTVCSPQAYGAAGGDMCSFGNPGDLPGDCRFDAGGALTFRSLPLLSDTDLLGQPELRLRVMADQPQGFVVVLLADEAPDGTQTLISRGFINLCHSDGHEKATTLEPGSLAETTVKLHATGYSVPEDHRLVVHISSTYWPICWPSPEPVTLSLAPGRSSLILPIFGQGEERRVRPLPTPPPASPPRATPVRKGSMERGFATDATSGLVAHRVYTDGGFFAASGDIRLDETGTVMGVTSERIYSIDPDPLNARATMDQEIRLGRDDWSVKIRALSEMTASATHFHLTARIECWDGDTLFHRAEWDDKIPRNGM